MIRHFPTIAALVAAGVLLAGCEGGMKEWQQTGYRGAGLDQIVDKSSIKKLAAIPAPPYALDASMHGGERASAAYQNVKVLGDLSTEEFNHLMASMNLWIAPGEGEGQGCNYCHNPENMASDEKYTKVVARRMIQMTRNLNSNWQSHVQQTGVTCWTCHRGNAVPVNKWAYSADPNGDYMGLRGNKHGQNTPDANVGYASLPHNAFAEYFEGTSNIRVAASSAHPSPDHVVSVKDAEKTYGLMMHLSTSLGVNCTYCHNTQSFRAWDMSRSQRNTAWYGIRMVRNVNEAYIDGLAPVFPAYRKGPTGDPYKVNCLTCHQGQAKPMNGVSMLGDYPQLKGPGAAYAHPGVTPASANATVAAFRAPAAMTGVDPAAVPEGSGATATMAGGTPQLNVYFATGESAVAPEAAERGAQVIAALNKTPGAKLSVSGYNDPRGDAKANALLAKKRAQGVAAALKAAGVPEDRIVLDKPADTTPDGDSNANARRVEVTLKK